MNTLIRNNSKFLKHSYGSSVYYVNSAKTPRKYLKMHYRSFAVLTYQFDGCLNIGSPSRQLSKYTAGMSTAPENRERPIISIYNYNAVREFHIGQRLFESASSKVEVTVKTMKDKQKEKIEEIMKEAASSVDNVAGEPAMSSKKVPEVTKQVPKSLKTRIWEEIVHYYHGFRLLFIDINICRKLLWRVLNGKTLSRRENNLLVRTTSDLFRLIPFSVFIIVPFMELLLPLFIKFFPGMLPSTFQTAKEREDKLKQSLQMKLEMAKFLQKTLDEMSVQHKEHKSEDAKQFATFFQKIKDPRENVSNDEIIKFAKRFEDEITLDSLSREQLSALCRLLELNTMGTTNFLRFQLRFKLRALAADDRVIAREGVNALDLFELQQACKARGMLAYGLTAERLRSQLQEWIDLSLNEKVPPSLLLLSRAISISGDTTTTDKLKETIRVLPDAVAAQTKAAIGEREGKIDNKTKIEIIKEEERKIKEERDEEREEEKAKADILVDKAPTIKPSEEPIMIDPAHKVPELPLKAKDILFAEPPAPEEKSISSNDVQLLSEAIKTLASDKKKMVLEKGTIEGLKEELEDYKEDVEELREVRSVVHEPIHESRAAKMLFKKVNTMIGQLDTVLADLEKKHQEMKHTQEVTTPLTPEETAINRKKEELVRIDELVQTIKKLKQTSDESRLHHIESVLSKLDTDKDGVLTMKEVLKVVEAIGRDNVKLNEKQIEELITLLDKEQLIETEEKIVKALAKSIKEAKKLEELTKQNEAKLATEELKDSAQELKDNAPELKDTAKDLHSEKEKTVSTTEAKVTPKAVSALKVTEKHKEKIIPKADLSSPMSTTIQPPPTTTSTQVNPKDKMI